MNHTQARQLIQAAADGLLTEANRRALDHHLAGCAQCQAYSADLSGLEGRLSFGLQSRWQGVQPRRFSLSQARAAAHRKESPGLRRLYQIVAIPAFQFGALAALTVGLVLLISSAASGPKTAENPSQTPSATPNETSLALAGTAQTSCFAVANIDVRVYKDHNAAAEIIGALPHGQTSPVFAYYLDTALNQVWLQINYNSGPAWIQNSDAVLTGDCSQVMAENGPTQPGPTATSAPTITAISPEVAVLPTQAPATPLPSATPAPTETPVGCVVAPSDDPRTNHNVYTGPSLIYPVIGSVGTSVYITATGIFSQLNYDTWIKVEYNGQAGWMAGAYLMFAGGGCWPLPPVDFLPHPPTLTPAPTEAVTEAPTQDPNVTEPPPVEFQMSVPGDLGTSQQFSAAFPWQGNTARKHRLSITVTGIPPGIGNDSRRTVDFTLSCIGGVSLTWGGSADSDTFHCGDTTRSDGLLWNFNTVQFDISVPAMPSTPVTYVMTVRVSAYPG